MSDTFAQAYRIIGDAAPGDALRAQRAVGPAGAEVVIKTIRPQSPATFLNGVARLASIHNAHLQQILAWEGHEDFVSIAAVPVSGVELGHVLAERVVLPPAEVLGDGAQAALGLAALHANGMVHGSVKPSNLLRATDGTIVLVDAGLTQSQGGHDLSASAPAREAAYVSPEEVLGRPLHPTSDVYSLGAVLYQLATGRLPFDGPDAATVAQAHVSTPVVLPRELNPAIPLALQAIILKALSKAPEERYSDGRELFQALDDELKAEAGPVAPAPVPAPPRPRRVWPWVVAGLVAVGVIIVALLWILGVFAPKVTVPNVTGMALSQATATLDNAGLKVGTVSYQQAAGKTQGTVLAQTPAAGQSAKKDSAVALVAVGQSVQTVPNVVGMAQSQATAAITSAGFALGNVTLVYDSTVGAGDVIDQAPAAGVTAPGGTPIALTVSKGPQPSASPQAQAVPDVTGQPQATAVSTLQSAGFTVVVDKLPSTTVPDGTVVDQTPSGGVFASKGSTVTIVVSTGGSTPTPSP